MKHHGIRAAIVVCCAVLTTVLLVPIPLRAQDVNFATNSLIIPMDTTYQDYGMLSAFGLVDKLLRAGVPVNWCILPGKSHAGVDFTASATDFMTSAVVTAHGYRGGPFVIAAADTGAASPIITAWQVGRPMTAVHVAALPFVAPVRLVLTASPKIAVLADGNQQIIFSYLIAAGITDESNQTWTGISIDLLTPAQVVGPSTVDPADGALFSSSGQPRFSALASGHWSASSTDIPNVLPELQSFLQFPVHLFAECQSVIAIENATLPGGFLTTSGYTIQPCPASVQFSSADLPFAQLDGTFQAAGGSEPAYGLAPGGEYYDNNAVMIRSATANSIGLADIWIAGYFQGTCTITSLGDCTDHGPKGKVTYLAGHQYTTSLPISTNPSTQGVRLFLNAILAGSCAYAEGQPLIALTAVAPESTTTAQIVVTLTCHNGGPGPGLNVQLADTLPPAAGFVAATGGGTFADGVVRWNLGDLASGASASESVTLSLSHFGTFASRATAGFAIGLTGRTATSNVAETVYLDPRTAVPFDPSPMLSLESFPGPSAGGRLILHFSLPRDESATIEVFDLRGREMLRRDVGQPGAGRHTLRLVDDHRLPSGVYFARLRTASGSRTIKVTLAR